MSIYFGCHEMFQILSCNKINVKNRRDLNYNSCNILSRKFSMDLICDEAKCERPKNVLLIIIGFLLLFDCACKDIFDKQRKMTFKFLIFLMYHFFALFQISNIALIKVNISHSHVRVISLIRCLVPKFDYIELRLVKRKF